MFSRGRMPGLGASMPTTMIDPSVVSSGIARLAAAVDAAGGTDAYIAQKASAAANQQAALTQQAQASRAPAPLAPVQGGMSLTTMAMYGVGGVAAIWLLMKIFKGGSSSSSASSAASLPVHKNPSRVPVLTRTDRLRNAVKSYESFHWGDKPSKFIAKKVSKPPKVGVKLGKLVSVAYETHKNGEHAVWEHEFGEEGGKRPDLVMDADNKRLHIVGGSYDVRPEGIID